MHSLKNKLLSLLLALAMLLPLGAVALPASAAERKATSPEDYDALLVKDGLVGWFDAYDAASPLVDLETGKWHSRVGDGVATLATPSYWKAMPGGGIGFEMTSYEEWKRMAGKVGLEMGIDNLPSGDFTVEFVARLRGITDSRGETLYHTTELNGNRYGLYNEEQSPWAFGGLYFMQFMPSKAETGASLHARGIYKSGGRYKDTSNGANGVVGGFQLLEDAKLGHVLSLSMTFDHKGREEGATYDRVTYEWSRNGLSAYVFDNTTTSWGAGKVYLPNQNEAFRLMYDFPGTVYAVRIYDRVLTKEEQQRNYFADLCRSLKIDVEGVSELPDTVAAELFAYATNYSTASSKEEIDLLRAAVKGISAGSGEFSDPEGEEYDALLVKDGLVGWYDAFDPQNGTVNLTMGLWHSRVGEGKARLTAPSRWREYEGGGIGYDMIGFSSWNTTAGKVGIDMGIENLPKGDFTVEYLMNLRGVQDEEGNTLFQKRELAGNQYGLYHGAVSSWAFGVLHFMQFLPSFEQYGASMRARGMYNYHAGYDQTGVANCVGDASIGESVLQTPTAFGATYRRSPGSDYDRVHFDWYRNGEKFYEFDNYSNTNSVSHFAYDNEKGRFRLMYDIAGTVYTVRVYDRVLTEEERRQNYFSDFCRMNGLGVFGVLDLSEGDRRELFSQVARYPLTASSAEREEVKALLRFFVDGNADVAEKTVSFAGISVRLDSPGIRFAYRVDEALLALLETRYKVTLGGVFALDAGDAPLTFSYENGVITPSLGECLTVYRTRDGFSSFAWIEDGVGERTFAITSLFGGALDNPQAFAVGMTTAAFLILEDEKGEVEILTFDGVGETFGRNTTLTDAVDHFVNAYEGGAVGGFTYNENETLRGILTRMGREVGTYLPGRDAERQHVYYVDPEAESGGNGTEDAPFQSIADAFLAAEELLSDTPSVAVTVYLADGVHRTSRTLTLEGEGARAEDAYFTVIGSEKAVVTGNREIQNHFTPVGDTGYYVTQLEKVNGEYPDFRYLYVDGEIATLAHQGYHRYADAVENGDLPFMLKGVVNDPANPAYAPKMYLDADAFLGMTEEEIVGTEVHMEIEWEFKVMKITGVDFSDRKYDDRVAVYFDEAAYREVVTTFLHFNDRYYWLENNLAFLDEPGEYYYDKETGKLYYYPIFPIEYHSFEYPTVEQVFAFYDMDHVTFRGFTVTGCDNKLIESLGYYDGGQAGMADVNTPTQAAIFGKQMDDPVFWLMHITEVAGDGISLRGLIRGAAIESCHISHVGSSAIRIGHGNATSGAQNGFEDSVIRNNLLEDSARFIRQSVALYVTIARDVKILHNSIHDTSYSGISIGWKWDSSNLPYESPSYNLKRVEIAYNLIEGMMSDMSDGGGIYTLGGNAEWGHTELFNSMHHNYVIVDDNTGAGKGRFMALYHDGASSNWHSYSNTVRTAFPHNPGLGAFYVQIGSSDPSTQQTHNLLVEENYFINADYEVPVMISGKWRYQDQNGNGRYDEDEEYFTDEEEFIRDVVFWDHVREEFNVIQRNNFCFQTEDSAFDACWEVMWEAGSPLDPEAGK